MAVLNLKHFMKNYNSKNDTMSESQSQKVYKYTTYPTDSKIYSDNDLLI